MLRNMTLAAAAAFTMALTAAASEGTTRQVPGPGRGTPDSQVPAVYSPRGVNHLRVTSNVGRAFDGGTLTATVWRWTDDRGTAFTLTRRTTTAPGRRFGPSEFTLQTVAPPRRFVRPVPPVVIGGGRPIGVRPSGGRLEMPPPGLRTGEIPGFYSPNGVNGLRMSSSVGQDGFGRPTTETVWRWRDDNGVSYRLTRVKAGSSTSFSLSKAG